MTTANSKTKLWPPIHRLTYSSGKVGWQVACMVNGQRIREAFPTKEEVETRAAQIRTQMQREGAAGFGLDAAVRAEAANCVEKLQAHRGATLTAAVDYYIAHCLNLRDAPPVQAMIARLLDEKKASNCRPRTLEDLRSRWGKFAEWFGDRPLSEFTSEEFTDWLNKVGTSPVNRHSYRRKIKELYRAAIRRKWAIENIVEATDRVLLDETTPVILTVGEAAALLTHAPDYQMLPYCVLGLFCGIRSDELQKLRWENVHFAQRTVAIDSKIARQRRQRIVPLNETAAAWLAHCVQRTGPMVDAVNFRKRFDAWRKTAGITSWPDNALRHSFGSYPCGPTAAARKAPDFSWRGLSDVPAMSPLECSGRPHRLPKPQSSQHTCISFFDSLVSTAPITERICGQTQRRETQSTLTELHSSKSVLYTI